MSVDADTETIGRCVPPPLPADHGKPVSPVTSGERILLLDVLRGVALLGILIANMPVFSQPLAETGLRSGLWFSMADRVVEWISFLLIDGKFYPLFSMLFGIGFAIQMDRAASRALDAKDVYLRRLYLLMGFGICHGIFLWDGDILLTYALCGFGLVPFRNRKPRTIMIWAGLLILLPALLFLVVGFFQILFWDRLVDSPAYQVSAMNHDLIRAYVTGGYLDTVAHRLAEAGSALIIILFSIPGTLGLFLIGMLIGRARILFDISMHRPFLKKAMILCGVVGLAGNLIGACVMMGASAKDHLGLLSMGFGIITIFGPILCAAYIGGAALLLDQKPNITIFRPVAAAGRMALTHYLMQSLIATTLFYGYGLGLAGHIGRLGTIGLALLIFAAQAGLSVVWLRHFRYGPMEWLWRSLTYKTRQPMR